MIESEPPPPQNKRHRDDAAVEQTRDHTDEPPRQAAAPPSASERQTLIRLASAGFELASFSLILGGAGYAVDHWMGNATPYVGIVGVMMGFCLGFYRLIVLASKIS